MIYTIDPKSRASLRVSSISSTRKLSAGDVLEIKNRFGNVEHIVKVVSKALNDEEQVELTLAPHETVQVQGLYS